MNFGQGNQEKSQETQDFCRPNHTSFLSFQSNQLKGVQKISSPNSCRKSNIQYIPSRTFVKL